MIAIHGKGYPTEFGVRYLDCVIITLYGEQLLQKQASVTKLYENACIINLNIFHWRFLRFLSWGPNIGPGDTDCTI